MDLVLAAAFGRRADCVVWDEYSAAFLALAGAVAANGNDWLRWSRRRGWRWRGRNCRTQRPKVGDLDRDPDAPAVLAHDLKLDREGQDPRHLALRQLVEQAVDLVANGAQLQPRQPAGERLGSWEAAMRVGERVLRVN